MMEKLNLTRILYTYQYYKNLEIFSICSKFYYNIFFAYQEVGPNLGEARRFLGGNTNGGGGGGKADLLGGGQLPHPGGPNDDPVSSKK